MIKTISTSTVKIREVRPKANFNFDLFSSRNSFMGQLSKRQYNDHALNWIGGSKQTGQGLGRGSNPNCLKIEKNQDLPY